jgi:predicted nucleic acid-binding protein
VPAEVPGRIENALDDPANALTLVPLGIDVVRAMARVPRHVVPDMPDRIIAATALHLNLPLVTRDRAILSSPIQTIW